MNDNERVLTDINRVWRPASELKSMAVDVDVVGTALTILRGLPEKFEHLIVAIDTMNTDRQLSLDFLKSRLLQEEQRLCEQQISSVMPNATLMSRQSRRRHCDYCEKTDTLTESVGQSREMNEVNHRLSQKQRPLRLWTQSHNFLLSMLRLMLSLVISCVY